MNILAGTKYRLDAKVEDSKGDPQTGVLAFRRIVDGFKARICNAILSNVAVALKPLADAEGILLFADSTHSSLRDGTTLRHSQTADQEAAFLLTYCHNTLQASNIVALVSDDDYGASFSKALGDNVQVLRYDPKAPDLKPIALKSAAIDSDAIVLVGVGGSLGELIRTIREGGYKGAMLATVAFDVVPSTRQVAGDAAKGLSYPRLVQDPDALNSAVTSGQVTNTLAGMSAIKVIAFNDAVFVAKALAAGKSQPKDIRDFLLNEKQIDGVGTSVTPRPDGTLLPRLEMTKVR
ncbi:MAG: ABC transporter substrate-binding protein [Kiritimatiellia bacterium]